MKLPLALKYDALPNDANAAQTTAALIRHAVNQTHKDGLPRSETRLWAGLERKFADGASEVELSLEQFSFIRDAVGATTWPVMWSTMADTLMDAIDEAEHAL